MLLLWFDFLRKTPCLCYSIKSSPRDMKYPSCLNPPYLTLDRCVETLHNIYWFSRLQKPVKMYIICILNFNVSLCWLVVEKALFFQDWVLNLFLFLNFYFSRFVSLGLERAEPIQLGFSYEVLTEISQSPSLVKFLIVQKKRAFRSDGLFRIIYTEESTSIFVNFEDS